MSASMRAKMKITSIIQNETSEKLVFSAVYKDGAYPSDGTDEDNTFAKWTPHAELVITINNPDLLNKFNVGDKYYLDFTIAK